MVFQYGQIIFETNTAPNSLRISDGANHAEQARIGSKPTLQAIGGTLTTISLSLTMHHLISPVQERIDALKAAMNSNTAHTLINGDGKIYGDFVITRCDTIITNTDNLGRVRTAEIDLELLEFISPNSADSDTLKARKAAFATVQANPIPVRPVPLFQSPENLVMRDISTTVTAAKGAKSNIDKARDIAGEGKKYLDIAKRGLDRADMAAKKAREQVATVADKVNNVLAIEQKLDNVISDIANITQNYSVGNINQIQALANGMNANINQLQTLTSQLGAITVLRK